MDFFEYHRYLKSDMKHSAIHNLTIKSFHEKLLNKEFTALEAAQSFFASIKERDSDIGAYLSLREEAALREAEAVDIAIAKGEEIGLLAGIPIAMKDNMVMEGGVTTAGSQILKDYVGSYDATVVSKLKDAKAVILGKTNLDEFAMGSSTENSGFHVTKNPLDTTRVPGGSSGGSTAAVAGDMALGAIGSDTGGSVRQPAAFCNVVGLKPTYGAVSRSGLIAMAASLNQVGPIAKTVQDTAILFNVIRGKDPLDARSVGYDYDQKKLLHPELEDIRKLTIGVPDEYFIEGLDPVVRDGVDSVIEKIKSLGLHFKKISLPHTRYALSCYYIIMPAEISSDLARFDGIRYARENVKSKTENGKLKDIYFGTRGHGFGREVKRRIILGTFVLSSGYYDAYYSKAQAVRAMISQDFNDAFKEVDVILGPVTPTPPFKIGEKTSDPLAMYLSDIFTIPANLAGLPAISIPVSSSNIEHRTSNVLPVGFQLIGKAFREEDILGIGQFYERI